jgi:hypothetical protein
MDPPSADSTMKKGAFFNPRQTQTAALLLEVSHEHY